jgi:hypothetical protein
MDNLLKVVAIGFVAVIGVMIVLKIVTGILSAILPWLIFGGAIYLVYKLTRPKSLNGRGGGYLP